MLVNAAHQLLSIITTYRTTTSFLLGDDDDSYYCQKKIRLAAFQITFGVEWLITKLL